MEAPAVPGLRTSCRIGGGSIARLCAAPQPAPIPNASPASTALLMVLMLTQTRTRTPALIESDYMRYVIFAAFLAASVFAQTPVKLRVDATDATRRLFHV